MQNANAGNQVIDEKNLELTLLKIYLKDLSFESPQAPEIFFEQIDANPDVHLTIKSFVNEIDGNTFEVVVILNVETLLNDKHIFVAELEYAALFTVNTDDEQVLDFALNVTCPNIIFPYMRETLDGLVLKAGFPPMLLDYFDFISQYKERQNKTTKSKAKKD